MSKQRYSYLFSFAAASVLAAALAGCGSSSSGDAAVAAAPAAGGGAAVAAPAAAGAPVGTAVITAAAAAPATTNTAANPAQAFGLIVTAGAAPVTVNSPPVVNFTVVDSTGKFVPGLTLAAASAAAAAADTNCSANNVTFAMAKYESSIGHWQSLISRQRLDASVTTPITRYSVVEGTTDPKPTAYTVTGTSVRANPSTAVADPTTRIVGILEENAAGGYYTYRFAIDVTKSLLLKDATAGKHVADSAASATAPAYQNRVANNGNLALKDGKTIHRIGAQLCYTDPATKAKVVVNPTIDFTINADGSVTPTKAADGKTLALSRKVVDAVSCNECHSALAAHGTRVDPNYCVICHNPGSGDYYNNTNVDMRMMVHKLHAAEKQKEWFGKTYKIASVDFSEVTYPQPLTNCVKCHDASKKDSAGNKLAAQGDNWKSTPTRAICGSCHGGMDFATGKGPTIANAEADIAAGKALGTTSSGHVGGAKADDTQCLLCHGAADIPVYHVTVDPTGANGRGGYPLNTATNVPTAGFASGQGPSIPVAAQMNLPAGVFKIDYEIKQVTVAGAAGAKKATVVYRVLKDGSPVTFNTTGYLMTNVDGSPSVYVSYATAQDGIAAPADWNASKSATILDIRDAKSGNSQTGPDASGYYTAILGAVIPDDAKMITAGIGINYNGFVQLGLSAYPKGIRLREPKFVMKLADGNTARRPIVSNDKCNSCHAQLGVGPSFHSGARNNGEGCSFGGCHDANKATGHVGAAYSYGGGWSVASKNLVHSIHASKKRVQAFTYEATVANPNGFKKVTYPGVLKTCEQCHVSGSYDFSGTANSAAVDKLLWTTEANGDMTNAGNVASLGLSPWITTLGKGQANYTSAGLGNLVTSPIAASCFGCHDSSTAASHMQQQGGSIYALFSSVASVATRPAIGTASTMTFTKSETCMLCHASGKTADIKAMHAK
jgi:OmcA/MtrC family decaheme c-type cytochrome